MVFFSCDGCGEMLKKNQVDAHVYRCRDGCYAVSCVDCSVSFPGDDYRNHTSCISEAERYEKTVYRGPRKGDSSPQKGKKMTPQEAWNHVLAVAAESPPPSIRRNLEQLSAMDNVPRKEKQFRNFAVNSLRLRGRDANGVVDAVWKYLSKVREEEQEKRQGGGQGAKVDQGGQQREAQFAAGGGDTSQVARSDKEAGQLLGGADGDRGEAKAGQSHEKKQNLAPSGGDKNNLCHKLVKKTMKKVLKKAPNRTMKMKKLRQEVKTRLMLKGMEKELKKAVAQQINVNRKKIKVDGKLVTLIS